MPIFPFGSVKELITRRQVIVRPCLERYHKDRWAGLRPRSSADFERASSEVMEGLEKRLSEENYSGEWHPPGEPQKRFDVYCVKDHYGFDWYVKFRIEVNIVMASFHLPDKPMRSADNTRELCRSGLEQIKAKRASEEDEDD